MDNKEVTRIRKHGTKVTKPSTPDERIAAIRSIVTNSQYAKVDGVMVDGFSASAIVQVYDAISDVNKVKFSSLPVGKMAKIAFKFAK